MKSSIIRFSAVALTAAMAFVMSCREDEEPTLSVNPEVEALEFSADGTKLTSDGSDISPTFTVVTNQKEWNAESNQSWLQVSRAGNNFTLSAVAHTSLTAPAAAEVTITAGTAMPVKIGVKQLAATPMLSVTPSNRTLVFSVDGKTATSNGVAINPTFTVTTNSPGWNAESNQSWLTVTKTGNQFTLSAKSNEDFADILAATVTVTAGDASIPFQVSQNGNPAGTPKAAHSTTTWEARTGDYKFVLSDYIEYDGDGKVAAGTITEFANSMTEGQYRDNPGYKGYVYNLAYVIANQDKLCPAPWRVPSPNDLKNLDKALGGTGEHMSGDSFEAELHLQEYVDRGFEYSGRYNPTNNQFQYRPGVGYITSNSTAAAEPNPDKACHLMIRNPAQNGDWAVYPWNEGATSQTKNFGLPVRCIKDVQ